MDTFCVLPWFGREISWAEKETHCCLLPKHYDINLIKSQMLAGEQPTDCQKCWNLEKHGLRSDRQVKNAALDWWWDKDLSFIKQEAQSDNTDIRMLKLLTSYTCNALCVSCGETSSSSWYNLKKQHKTIPINQYKFVDLDLVKQKVDFKKLICLSLIGGEPLYEKKNFDLLEYLIELGNNSVFLSIVTNGSVALTSRQKSVLSKFKNVNFSLSIDGTGPVFEYVRYPLKWNQLENNLRFFKEVTDNNSVNYTISNLNILNHNETTAWFRANNLPFSNNPIYSPSWLQPRALPESVKSVLKQRLTITDYNTFIGDHTEKDQQNFKTFLKEIDWQDSVKGISYKNYLPELAQLLNN
jgi:hypothetical protein